MENPYLPPTQAPPASPAVFHWKRVIAWSILIIVAANVVGLISGFTMGHWQMYASTINEAIINARLVRRIGFGVVGAMLYWRFAAGVTSKPLVHVLALFALVQGIDLSLAFFLYSVPSDKLFDLWSLSRSFLAAMIGLGLTWLGSINLFERKSLRDTA